MAEPVKPDSWIPDFAKVVGGDLSTPSPPKITDKAAFEALAPGSDYVDPEGKTRVKPYTVTDNKSYAAVPEGAFFLDPDNKLRKKPVYEALDFWPQTLIDAAHGNPEQTKRILEGEYGAKNIKIDPVTKDLYVEKDGKRLKSNVSSPTAAIAGTAALAAPMALGVAGALLGGASGSIVPGAGTAAGGAVGAGLGGAAGEAFNQSILALAGYPSTIVDEAKHIALEGAASGVGQAGGSLVGRGIGKIADAIAGSKRLLGSSGLSSLAAYILGAQPEETKIAAELQRQGVKVRPSAYLKESPKLGMYVEVFDPKFRKQEVLRQSANAYYDKEAAQVMREAGLVPPAESLTKPVEPVSVEPLGATMLRRAQAELSAADSDFNNSVRALHEALRRRPDLDPAAYEAAMKTLAQREEAARSAAQSVVDLEFKGIESDIRSAIKTAQANGNPGDLIRLADEKIWALRKAVGERAKVLYQAADAAAGDVRPDVSGLSSEAAAFLDEVPEGFEGRYRPLARQIKNLIPGEEGATEPPTFEQLRNLRSALRSDVDANDLTPGVKSGVYRRFIKKIDDVLYDEAAPEQLRKAAELLRKADDFYGKNIAKFKSDSLKWAVEQLEAGVPADPKTLAAKFFQPGQTEEIRMARKVVGKPLWTAMQAADVQTMLDNSKTLVPGEVDASAFVREVLQRDRDGILDAAYDKAMADRMKQQAARVAMMEGKLPMSALPGDTLTTLLNRADALAAEIKDAAARDPVKLLASEAKRLDKEIAKMRKLRGAERRADPLNFLTNPSMGAIEAANNILSKPDKIIALAQRYGEHSPEFNMLRQVWVQRLLQRSLEGTKGLAGEFSGKIANEIQQRMFPGVSLSKARTLVRNMDFLLGELPDVGASMAATERVTRAKLEFMPFGTDKMIPAPIRRTILAKTYSVVTWAVTHPWFSDFIEAGLSGTDPMKLVARKAFQDSYTKWLAQKGGMAGLLAGEYMVRNDEARDGQQ